jgi:hypothetical protein
MRPEFSDPHEATRVSSFIEEAALGRWKIERFTVDGAEERRNVARAIAQSDSAEEARMRAVRAVPPGDYVSLRRKMTPEEAAEHGGGHYEDGTEFDGWVPVMSDTPSEIHEHDFAIENATGRVLITGLGLGVLVSALLAKPDVQSITVVEVDRDVIGLTGHYYMSHPKVSIVHADALEYAKRLHQGDGSRLGWEFDFAWHDIWSAISHRNLTDDRVAEHGISYKTLFTAYAPFAARQGAWAFPEATEQKNVVDLQLARRRRFVQTWRTGTDEQKIEALIDGIIRDQIGMTVPSEGEIPDEIREFFIKQMDLRAWAEHIVRDDGLDIDKLASDLSAPDEPIGSPNLEGGANIAGR